MSDPLSEQSPLRPFPMQGGPPIPWFLAQAIYDNVYGHTDSQTIERLAERGGFGWSEVQYMWNTQRFDQSSARVHPYGTRERRERATKQLEESWPK